MCVHGRYILFAVAAMHVSNVAWSCTSLPWCPLLLSKKAHHVSKVPLKLLLGDNFIAALPSQLCYSETLQTAHATNSNFVSWADVPSTGTLSWYQFRLGLCFTPGFRGHDAQRRWRPCMCLPGAHRIQLAAGRGWRSCEPSTDICSWQAATLKANLPHSLHHTLILTRMKASNNILPWN